jgi:HK97 family phage portal protein
MRDFLRYNQISLYTNRALAARAEKVGGVEFVLKKGDRVIEDHPLLDLLSRPNSFHTGKQFWELYKKYMDITGCAFIYMEKSTELFDPAKVKQMHLLRPDLVKIKFDEFSNIVGFEYTNPAGGINIFMPEEIMYDFNPDPLSPLLGESLLKAGIREIDTSIQLSEYQNKILRNGGKLEGVFKFKTQTLTKQQVAEMKDQYKDQYAQAKNAGLPLFLGGDAEYQNLTLNPTELSYLESKKVTLNDISILTGVPRQILSVTDGETYANSDAAIAIFLRETIKPLLIHLTDFLDWRLVPMDMDLEYIDPTPEDIDRKIKLLTAANAVNALTTNEKREMLGLDPLTDKEADMVLIPFNLTPLTGVDEVATEKTTTKMEKGFHHPLKDATIRSKYAELQFKRLTRRESKAISAMKTYFKEQENRIIEGIQGNKYVSKKTMVDRVFDKSLEAKLAKGTILPIIESALREAGEDTVNLFDTEHGFIINNNIASWLDQRSELFANEINTTTYKKLTKVFSESTEAGESYKELITRIQDVYEGYTSARALMIARTETHGAMQEGTLAAYKQVGSPIKIWVWSPGDQGGIREEHAAIDGEERPLDMPFSNGLMMPGDSSGGADEVINCACTI